MRDRFFFLFLIFGLLFTTQAYALLTDNLVSYYNLGESNGNAIDSLGLKNLTQTGTVPSQTGIIGGARGAYSVSNYFTNTNVLTLNENINYSFNLWIKRTGNITTDQRVIQLGGINSGDYSVFLNFVSANKITAEIDRRSVNPEYAQTSTNDLNLNEWTMVTFTYNGSTRQGTLYINGTQDKQATANDTTYNNGSYINLGSYGVGANPFTSGYTDEIGYWDRILTTADINELYNSGAGLTYPFAETGITVDFNYYTNRSTQELILTDLSTDTNGTINDWNWTIADTNTFATTQNAAYPVIPYTDYNICLRVKDNLLNQDIKCELINSGKIYGDLNIYFYDENTLAPITTTFTINPTLNGVTVGTDYNLTIDLQGITSQLYGFQFSATGYGTRFYYTDLNQFSDVNYNYAMLKDTNASNVTLNIYDANGLNLLPGTPVTITKNNYLVGRYLTNTDGAINPFIADVDTNYLFNIEGEYNTNQRAVLVYRPKYDSNFGDIAGNWQITLIGPNSTRKYSISTNSQVVAILPNTETLYSTTVCMLLGSVCNTNFFSRTYLLGFKGLVGETSIQPYLNLISDSTLRTLKVLDYATNQPYPLAKIVITSKTNLGVTYVLESLYTDSTGTAGVYLTDGMTYTLIANDLTPYTIVPNASTLTYYIYFNFLVLPTETVTGLDVNTYSDFNGAEFFVMRNALFGCSGTSDCFPSALIAIVLTMIILVVATAVTVGNFIGVKGLSLIAFLCFVIFFGIGWLPIYIFAFLGSITLLLLVVVQ